jgi:hypothetical protein
MKQCDGSSWRFLQKLISSVNVVLLLTVSVFSQTIKSTSTKHSPLCTYDSAVQMALQQINATKTIDDPVQRISILVRGADLLWPYERQKSRTAFAEAFALARGAFKKYGDAPKRSGRGLLTETPDQRYVVIRAVAKRDEQWARQLTEEVLREDAASSNQPGSQDSDRARTADKLLQSAMFLLSHNIGAANELAEISLRYPATLTLTRFMYKLAELNQAAADDFYMHALTVYGGKPLREFLYLAAYPFGADHSGDMPVMGNYSVPATFLPNSHLQNLFVRKLVERSRYALENGVDEVDNYNELSGLGHIVQTITSLEQKLQDKSPALSEQMIQLRSRLLNSLSAETQATLLATTQRIESTDRETFEERVEAIANNPNANKRDELLVTTILNARSLEPLENILKAAAKIEDISVRSQLLDWFYFNRSRQAKNEKHFEEAAKLARNVQQMDQRAYLYSEIATELIQQIESQSELRQMLEEIVGTAQKAESSMVSARALLAAATLYLKIDPDRAVAVLANAIQTINRLESPDFSEPLVIRKIEGRNFARYAAYQTPSFNPETAFRNMAQLDFDSAIVQSTTIIDRLLRAQVSFALADYCLAQPKQKTGKS